MELTASRYVAPSVFWNEYSHVTIEPLQYLGKPKPYSCESFLECMSATYLHVVGDLLLIMAQSGGFNWFSCLLREERF